MQLTPIIKLADWLGIEPKARGVFGYNFLDVIKNLLSFWIRSRFMPGGGVGQAIGGVGVAALTGVMVGALGKLQEPWFGTRLPPGKHVKHHTRKEGKKVPTVLDTIATMGGKLAPVGDGQTIMQMFLTIAFAALNMASKVPALNGEDKLGRVIKPGVKFGSRIATAASVVGAFMAWNETAHRLYHKLEPEEKAMPLPGAVPAGAVPVPA
jgi:hypothetical protein